VKALFADDGDQDYFPASGPEGDQSPGDHLLAGLHDGVA
jgi:hypothetical protein